MAKFELDTEFVRKLATILEETKLGEIELVDGERRIRVRPPPLRRPHRS
jgi:acetyl-CoA carboxylase biotin carboxyl carrier protein